MKSQLLILIFVLSLIIPLTASLFMKEPPVWPDETIYADTAFNLIHEGRLATDLWKNNIPGVDIHIFFYPPVFFYLLTIWLQTFGFTIETQRAFSVFTGIVFLFIFFKLASTISRDKWVPYISVSLLLMDFMFLRSTLVSRPEIVVLFEGTSAILLFRKYEMSGKLIFAFLSGLLASLAFLTHIIGAFVIVSIVLYLCIAQKLKITKNPGFYALILPFLALVSIWVVTSLPYFEILKQQILLNFERKGMDPILWDSFPNQPFYLNFLYIFYFVQTFGFGFYSFLNKKKEYYLLAITLVMSSLFAFYGRMLWYFSLPTPFVYLASAILLRNFQKPSILRFKFIMLSAVSASVVVASFNLHLIFLNSPGGTTVYYNFTNEVLKNIPDNQTVFLSSIPDPYYGFKKAKRGNFLFEFPVVARTGDKEDYLKTLNNSDYIVYNGSYNTTVFGNLLEKYILKNTQEVFNIGWQGQYQAKVFKLTDKNLRTFPTQ